MGYNESSTTTDTRRHDPLFFQDEFCESFGQHEQLTTRINRLLEGYSRDASIFKELLQNADDAGATEVCHVTFAFSPRIYPVPCRSFAFLLEFFSVLCHLMFVFPPPRRICPSALSLVFLLYTVSPVFLPTLYRATCLSSSSIPCQLFVFLLYRVTRLPYPVYRVTCLSSSSVSCHLFAFLLSTVSLVRLPSLYRVICLSSSSVPCHLFVFLPAFAPVPNRSISRSSTGMK